MHHIPLHRAHGRAAGPAPPNAPPRLRASAALLSPRASARDPVRCVSPPGAFDVEEFKIASPAFGIPYFLLFILLMFLILMNIFLAILGEAYSFVREQMDQTSEQQVQTKKRSLKEYVKLICTVLKKKQAARRSAKEAKRAEALAKAEKRTSGMAARMA